MKSKKELLDALNKLVITDICCMHPDVQNVWEGNEFQKKLAQTIGVKPKDLNNSSKRNKSSYLFFCQDIRPSIISETPDIKPNQVMVHLGKKWSELSAEDRKKYDALALEDRKRYIASKDANKKLNRPVKISTYLQFCADERPALKLKFPELYTKDITSKLGAMWNDYKKNNPQYLKTKYGYESVKDGIENFDQKTVESRTSRMVPSIPASICSSNIKAIQDLIGKSSKIAE